MTHYQDTFDDQPDASPSLLPSVRSGYPPPMHRRRIAHLGSARTAGAHGASTILAALALLGCGEPPVQWDSTRTVPAIPTGMVSPDGALHPDTMALLAGRIPPPERAVCPGSLALSRAGASCMRRGGAFGRTAVRC